MVQNPFANSRLLESPAWVLPTIDVSDGGFPMRFSIQDAFNYHGYDAPGGVALGFRLLQRAFSLLVPGEVYPDRRGLSLFTAFPGLGLRDTMELVTRLVTEDRFRLDTAFDDPRAQEGVAGRFYYRFTYEKRSVELAPLEGYPGEEFVRLGKASKVPGFDGEEAEAWRNAKYQLANTLLGAPAEAVIRIL